MNAETKSKYAQKARLGNRLYAPCRTSSKDDDHSAWEREISQLKYWVSRIRHERGKGFEDSAVTLEDIAERKAQLKQAA